VHAPSATECSFEVLYAGGLRVSEIAGLTWSDVLPRDTGVQLSVQGRGGIVRQVLLPEAVSRSLLSIRGDAGANDPVFASAKGGGKLTERAVLGTVKRAVERAGITAPISDWLRHAHASHAIDRGARVTAHRIAQPPKVTFVTRLTRPSRSSASGPIDNYPGGILLHW
jgi:site-specific recombinase XerD